MEADRFHKEALHVRHWLELSRVTVIGLICCCGFFGSIESPLEQTSLDVKFDFFLFRQL